MVLLVHVRAVIMVDDRDRHGDAQETADRAANDKMSSRSMRKGRPELCCFSQSEMSDTSVSEIFTIYNSAL